MSAGWSPSLWGPGRRKSLSTGFGEIIMETRTLLLMTKRDDNDYLLISLTAQKVYPRGRRKLLFVFVFNSQGEDILFRVIQPHITEIVDLNWCFSLRLLGVFRHQRLYLFPEH